MTTRFGIKLRRVGIQEPWWCGGISFAADPIAARWFQSVVDAELTGLRELPDPRSDWAVVPIPEQDK